MLAKLQQYEIADRIVKAACKAGEIDYCHFIERKKDLHLNVLRGVACVISRYNCVHPQIMASIFQRTRSNVINVAKKYHHYLQAKDKLTVRYYNLIQYYFTHEQ